MKETIFKRKRVLIAGLVIYVLVGFLNAWSNFVAPIEEAEGWTRTEISVAFSICMMTYGLSCIFGGMITGKLGAQNTIRIGAFFLFMGLYWSGMAEDKLTLYLGYGVIFGLGVGLVYVAGMSAVQKWFPERIGLICGVLLTTYGLGATILGSVSVAIIVRFNWHFAFKVMAILIGAGIFVASFFLGEPDEHDHLCFKKIVERRLRKSNGKENLALTEEGIEIGPKEMLKRRSFYLYFFWFVAIASYWMGAISSAATFALDMGATVTIATVTSGIITFCNGGGRLFAGWLHDNFSRRRVMMLTSVMILVGCGLLFVSLTQQILWMLLLAVGVTGIFYGCAATTNAVFIRRFYGNENYAKNFGIVSCNGIFCAFTGGYMGPFLAESFGNYVVMMCYFLAMAIIAFVLQLKIKKP